MIHLQVPLAKDVVRAVWASDLEAEVQDAGAMVEKGRRPSWLTCPAVSLVLLCSLPCWVLLGQQCGRSGVVGGSRKIFLILIFFFFNFVRSIHFPRCGMVYLKSWAQLFKIMLGYLKSSLKSP